MAVVNMQEAKTRLSQLVARAETGEELLIACAGRPAVRLAPVSPRHPARGHGSMPELVAWADAILELLPEDELRRWGAAAESARLGGLLDTHALIWWFAGSGPLSEAARAAIEDPAHTKLLSAASAWEIATKRRLGRLPEAERAGLVCDLLLLSTARASWRCPSRSRTPRARAGCPSPRAISSTGC